MKRIIGILFFACMAISASAQDGSTGVINLKPQRVVPLPGIYEYLGFIIQGKNNKLDAIFITDDSTLSSKIEDSLKQGIFPVMRGIPLDPVLANMIKNDYMKPRLALEDSLRSAISKTWLVGKKKKLEEWLAKEEANLKDYETSHANYIFQRGKYRTIWTYGFGASDSKAPDKTVPVTPKSSNVPPQPD